VGTKGINKSHHYLTDQKEKLGNKQWMAIDEKKFFGQGLKNDFGPTAGKKKRLENRKMLGTRN
jgi:hypothetical protein